MVVDYSETVNKYTQLDAYPFPKIDKLVNDIAKYKIYSTIDLRSAYYQIPLSENDSPYTAFEADGGLWEFTRMPFGVTNGSACFQRKMDKFVTKYDTFPFIDNVTICGNSQEEHDENLNKFNIAAEKEGLTLSPEKCVFSTPVVDLLGYRISHNTLQPDPERLASLINLPTPTCSKSLKRVIGMFSYYARWIQSFSDKIKLLNSATHFPLNQTEVNVFESLKTELAEAAMQAIDENVPFTVETDASSRSQQH